MFFAEVVSDTDHAPVAGEKPWIAIRAVRLSRNPPCEAVVLIDPYRVEVTTDLRTERGVDGHPSHAPAIG